MNDFIFHNPDKVYFGRNQMGNLPGELLKYGRKVLLVYGGGSIKRSGLYDQVVSLVGDNGMELFELSGVEPNPRHTTANKGAAICRKEGIDVILAVGGGSTIDCAKGVAAAAKTENGDVWPLVSSGVWVMDALPLVAVLTNAATGSEMDAWCVISNMETNEKIGLGGDALIPKAAFENPEFSFTLPPYQTACGAFDIFNHVLDNYYLAGNATFDLVLEMQEAVMRTVVKWTPVALKEPDNYEARANLMWASSMALNSILDAGTVHACACHGMEHELSAYYDITHGHGLAILTPRWLTYILNEDTAPAICRLGERVFGLEKSDNVTEGAKKAIEAVSTFAFDTLGLEPSLTRLGIDETHFRAMAEHVCGESGIIGVRSLNADDVVNIYKMCLQRESEAFIMEEKLNLTMEWDKTFPKSDRVNHSKVTFHNRYGITLAADLYVPKDAQGQLPAIAVCGPFGAVKEQSSGLYAQTMAERGFLTIAFDPSYTGESGGQPRYMASPDINTEDFMAAVDFLSVQDNVDPEKIGIIGICGWGGMALNAAVLDTRIKATVASTMYDMTRVNANGYFDSEDSEEARYEKRKALCAQRIADYRNGTYALGGGVVDPLPEDAPFFVKDYYDYYKTKRGYHPRSLNSNGGWNVTGCQPFMNMPILQYSQEIRNAVLIIHGEKAHSCYFSRDAFAKLTGENKELMIIPGAVHTDLYDQMDVIPFDKLESFFKAYLN